jgi:hypothetical protein
VNANGEYPYPDDVITEVAAEITVRGLEYRGYTRGAASGGGQHSHLVEVTHPEHEHDVEVPHPNHDHDVTIGTVTSESNTEHTAVSASGSFLAGTMGDTSGFWDTLDTITPPASFEVALVNLTPTDSDNTLFLRLRDSGTLDTYPGTDGVLAAGNDGATSDIQGGEVAILIPEEVDNDIEVQYETPNGGANANLNVSYLFAGDHTHDVNIGTPTSETYLAPTNTETSTRELGNTISETTADETPLHTHDSLTGVELFPTETPSNCDLVINGTTVASNIGSGVFTETIDVSGEFVSGVNDIEVTSDSVGFISAYVTTQLFRSGREA